MLTRKTFFPNLGIVKENCIPAVISLKRSLNCKTLSDDIIKGCKIVKIDDYGKIEQT